MILKQASGNDRRQEDSAAMPSVKLKKTGGCPVAAFQKLISGKYKLRIVWDLKDGPLRYGEIRSGLLRGIEGTQEIAPRVLSRELKALVHSGLIARKDYGVVPPKVDYRLTRKGQSFVPVIAAIRDWGHRHLAGSSHGPSVAIAAE
jgi:DNA-binding HxlR family transcriptional regulator